MEFESLKLGLDISTSSSGWSNFISIVGPAIGAGIAFGLGLVSERVKNSNRKKREEKNTVKLLESLRLDLIEDIKGDIKKDKWGLIKTYEEYVKMLEGGDVIVIDMFPSLKIYDGLNLHDIRILLTDRGYVDEMNKLVAAFELIKSYHSELIDSTVELRKLYSSVAYYKDMVTALNQDTRNDVSLIEYKIKKFVEYNVQLAKHRQKHLIGKEGVLELMNNIKFTP